MKMAEIFASIQGEGLNTGMPAIFVRLAGCNLSCPWCDTNHKSTGEASPSELASVVSSVIASSGIYQIVITGGEPFLQKEELLEFIKHLRAGNVVFIAIETNGTIPFRKDEMDLDFVAVSPKEGSLIATDALLAADEIKIIVEEKYKDKVVPLVVSYSVFKALIWLQPEGNKPENVKACERIVFELPLRARIGHQIHKMRGWR